MNLWTKEIIIRDNKVIEDNRRGVNNACFGGKPVCIFTYPLRTVTGGVHIIIQEDGMDAPEFTISLDGKQLEHFYRLLQPYMG